MSIPYTLLTEEGYLPLFDPEPFDLTTLPPTAARPQNFFHLQRFPQTWAPAPHPALTVQALVERHKALRQKLLPSYTNSLHPHLKKIRDLSPKITNSIFLGVGSLTAHSSSQDSDTVLSKLILFEIFLKLLLKQGRHIPIYFQEPCFNAVDREFLTHRGYKVLESPESNDVINEGTILWAPINCWDVIFASLGRCFPAMLVTEEKLDEARGYFYWRPTVGMLLNRFCEEREVEEIKTGDGDEEWKLVVYCRQNDSERRKWAATESPRSVAVEMDISLALEVLSSYSDSSSSDSDRRMESSDMTESSSSTSSTSIGSGDILRQHLGRKLPFFPKNIAPVAKMW